MVNLLDSNGEKIPDFSITLTLYYKILKINRIQIFTKNMSLTSSVWGALKIAKYNNTRPDHIKMLWITDTIKIVIYHKHIKHLFVHLFIFIRCC